ncbi:MAG: hypothetical protein IIB89_04390 [Chloroflexi bacterium]|nr:hypothetical protein [Chloroflexota bacterium]
MQESHKRVQWVYQATNNKELEDRYDQWAVDYDNDLAAEFAWNAPQNATDVFVKHVEKSGPHIGRRGRHRAGGRVPGQGRILRFGGHGPVQGDA